MVLELLTPLLQRAGHEVVAVDVRAFRREIACCSVCRSECTASTHWIYDLGSVDPVTAVDMPQQDWPTGAPKPTGIPAHIERHIATMAKMLRTGRYDRGTQDVELVTGLPALNFAAYVADHRTKHVD
jgi:hypothetical protein